MQFDQVAETNTPITSIKVVGVGGGGGNAVNRMIVARIKTAQFIAINTDKKSLLMSKADYRIQIGEQLTDGQGAGADPNIGRLAAEESRSAITQALKGADMVFITAGMGGGTGTGAAPIVAEIAKELKILTIGIVTTPFDFECKKRMQNALAGIANLRGVVDTLIVIPNEKLTEVYPNPSVVDAFKCADDVLRQAIQGISEIITCSATINIDFADFRTIMKNAGIAHLGIGEAKGENRMMQAMQNAVYSPLLTTSIEGASKVLMFVEGGETLGLDEVKESANLIKDVVHPEANLIFGMNINDSFGDSVVVTVVATGFEQFEQEGSIVAPDIAKSADRYSRILGGETDPATEKRDSAFSGLQFGAEQRKPFSNNQPHQQGQQNIPHQPLQQPIQQNIGQPMQQPISQQPIQQNVSQQLQQPISQQPSQQMQIPQQPMQQPMQVQQAQQGMPQQPMQQPMQQAQEQQEARPASNANVPKFLDKLFKRRDNNQ